MLALRIAHVDILTVPQTIMITKDRLISFFNETREMKRAGQAKFDIDQVCRWSYFLIDPDRDKLVHAGRFLEKNGYEVVGFLEPAPEDGKKMIYLRFDMLEVHTPDTLFERNTALYQLAKNFGLADYDGMDVGAVDGP